jgi:hypothetical protein
LRREEKLAYLEEEIRGFYSVPKREHVVPWIPKRGSKDRVYWVKEMAT